MKNVYTRGKNVKKLCGGGRTERQNQLHKKLATPPPNGTTTKEKTKPAQTGSIRERTKFTKKAQTKKRKKRRTMCQLAEGKAYLKRTRDPKQLRQKSLKKKERQTKLKQKLPKGGEEKTKGRKLAKDRGESYQLPQEPRTDNIAAFVAVNKRCIVRGIKLHREEGG